MIQISIYSKNLDLIVSISKNEFRGVVGFNFLIPDIK